MRCGNLHHMFKQNKQCQNYRCTINVLCSSKNCKTNLLKSRYSLFSSYLDGVSMSLTLTQIWRVKDSGVGIQLKCSFLSTNVSTFVAPKTCVQRNVTDYISIMFYRYVRFIVSPPPPSPFQFHPLIFNNQKKFKITSTCSN